LDLYPRYEILSCHQRNETRRTSHSQTLKQKWLKSFKTHTRRKQWINPHSCGLKEMPHSSIEETAPYRLITAAREATSQKQTYQEGSYLIHPTQQIRKRGRTLYSFNTAEKERGCTSQSALKESHGHTTTTCNRKGRGRSNRGLHQQKRPRQ
jgi:hypothetical protein